MNESQSSSELLTVAEVAHYLRVSETTVWRWCSSGRLPAFRIGRGWRMRRVDLEKIIGGNATEVAATNDIELPTI